MSHPYKIDDLLAIMARLRDPQTGCPWDLRQTFTTLVPFTLEEAYEVAETIERSDWSDLKGELGDLLFQVIFYAQIGQEQGRFDFDEVVSCICEKLIRRHPHIFAAANLDDEAAVMANWEAEKGRERAQKAHTSLLDDIPLTQPALSRALKIQKRCASVGFDWGALPPVVDKIHEEIDEVLAEALAPEVDAAKVADELGDLLFACVNLVRHLKQDPEQVLRAANAKFERRFRGVERLAGEESKSLSECDLDTMTRYWDAIKTLERQN